MKTNPENQEINEELFELIAQGDDHAFTELYYATFQKIYGFLLSLTKNKEDAEDLLQNTYIKIRNGAHLYKKQGTPMTWMCTVAKNQFLDFVRKKNRAKIVDWEEVKDYAIKTPKEQVAESIENKVVLSAALSILNQQERTIFILHIVDGLKHREIAELTGLTQNTVITKYNRSLKKMKNHLEQEGGHHAGKRY